MKHILITSNYKKLLADTITPVSTYLKLRDKFPNSLLLESSDYHSRENSYSYICCDPVAGFSVTNNIVEQYIGTQKETINIGQRNEVLSHFKDFTANLSTDIKLLPFTVQAFFGYMSYEAVQYFEEISLNSAMPDNKKIPEIFYQFYRYILVFDHYKNELYIIQNEAEEFGKTEQKTEQIENIINNRNFSSYPFNLTTEEDSNLTDKEYMELVEKGIHHCRRGDVFQIVLSREFHRGFKGDEFNVYRALRAINPSPYLFYFDYGNFKIFGSSPEAQLTVKDGIAAIHPIAGTYRRSGDKSEDEKLAKKLQMDAKENAEHVMLVDLARNDLSRNTTNVKVDVYGEIQYFSHVIHMVSKVTGEIKNGNPIQLAADTFPAGTLSGAPKFKAMELIDTYEQRGRSFYGGAVGFIGLDGEFNHAIIIRSFLSKNNQLIYQAGAGIVVESKPKNELKEVNNKIEAVRKAIEKAAEL